MTSSKWPGLKKYLLIIAAGIVIFLLIFLPPRVNNVPPDTTATTSKPPLTETSAPTATENPGNTIKTVWIIVLENHNWSQIYKNSSAPYINNTLLPQASYATQYFNPPNLHPSEPNYLWLEAGTAFGIKADGVPAEDHQATTQHLVTLLNNAGISWKAYEEGVSGNDCPLVEQGFYVPRHNPMVFFDDVTNNNDPQSAYCIAHIRPFSELKSDLQDGIVSRYNFITPNLCDNMHNQSGCNESDPVKAGDTWLSQQIPMILNSQAYTDGGAIFITWDESQNGDHPIGMIVLSPAAKGGGYSNSIHYTHSSTLRTFEEIFGVEPLLGDAANATDLSDLFRSFP